MNIDKISEDIELNTTEKPAKLQDGFTLTWVTFCWTSLSSEMVRARYVISCKSQLISPDWEYQRIQKFRIDWNWSENTKGLVKCFEMI